MRGLELCGARLRMRKCTRGRQPLPARFRPTGCMLDSTRAMKTRAYSQCAANITPHNYASCHGIARVERSHTGVTHTTLTSGSTRQTPAQAFVQRRQPRLPQSTSLRRRESVSSACSTMSSSAGEPYCGPPAPLALLQTRPPRCAMMRMLATGAAGVECEDRVRSVGGGGWHPARAGRCILEGARTGGGSVHVFGDVARPRCGTVLVPVAERQASAMLDSKAVCM